MLNGPTAIENQRINVAQLTQTEVINRSFVTDGGSLSELAQLPSPERAELPDGTVVFSQTPTYAVRVFTRDGQPYINLFNRASGRQELNGVRAIAASSVEGIAFSYAGSTSEGRPSVQVNVAANGAQTIEVNDAVQTNSASVTGTVTYLPRIAMPPNAVLEVSLIDVSRADAPAVTLASQSMVFGDRQVPLPFELVYNPDQIDPRLSYAVQARILVDGELRFINTSRFAVITQGNPTSVEVRVDPVSR
ncbi:YbaY family lipoprotein [Nodosilinea sp. LEGE 06152]|nr:YbaY family lipoprotein [Nodosilinea sp. LEGE 06152]